MAAAPEQSYASQLSSVRVGVRPELEVSRHIFSDVPSYVVRDPISFQSHRFSSVDYQVLTAITSHKTLGEIRAELVDRETLDEDQEEEFYQFVVSLTQIGLLNLPVSDGARLYKRYQERQRAKRKNRLMSVLFLRVPLFQPDHFLRQTVAFVRPLFTWVALVAWLCCLLTSLVVIASRWSEVTSPLASILAAGNIPVLWTLLVGLKVVHEFGHAYACKRFGGQVPEMGAYFILFTPCAYVDASASWGFTSRWQRIVVALAGMYFESIAAMFALAVWVLTPQGMLHDAAHYAVVLSTVVTIAFNMNPLMRYDGYYILSDLLGIPNLRSQAERQVRRVLARLLYGTPGATPANSTSQGVWLTLFGIAGAIYKPMLVCGISLLIAQKLPLVGIGVAGVYVFQAIRQSGAALISYLRTSDELAGRRKRATLVTAACLGLIVVIVAAVPVPGAVETLAVAAPLQELIVRAESPGFVRLKPVESGDEVKVGLRLCQLENIDLEFDLRRLEFEEASLQAAWNGALLENRREIVSTESQLAKVTSDRQTALQKYKALEVTSPADGVVIQVHADRPGAFLHRGDPVVTLGSGPWTVRALLTAEQIVDARLQIGKEVRFRLIGRPADSLVGRVIQVAPQGVKKVELAELTQLAGGEIAVDPNSAESATPLFEVAIEIGPQAASELRTGATARVRFEGEAKTLLMYLCRRGRQLLNDLRLAS